MRQTTRTRILDYLRKQQTASVSELSRALGTTGANIRHHLAVLESNALIVLITRRQEGRGRPVNIYGISQRVMGDGAAELAKAMLEVWLKNTTEEIRKAGLKSVARQLGGAALPDINIALHRRLAKMVDRLNELHYQARWEAGIDGPHVILGQCPYSEISSATPELCLMDMYLLEHWTGTKVEQAARLQASTKGYPFCSFRIVSAFPQAHR